MGNKVRISLLLSLFSMATGAVADSAAPRALWASINGNIRVVSKEYVAENNKVLVSWRMLPGDTRSTAFDLYRTVNGVEAKVNETPIVGRTNYQDPDAPSGYDISYRITYAGNDETIGYCTINEERVTSGLPYISIPLVPTNDIHPVYPYLANDASVGDLDGDGEYEIVLKRCVNTDGSEIEEGEDGSTSQTSYADVEHTTLLEAYKLDGTMMWRVKSGPNIILGNSWSFAVEDFDGDGRAEIAVRTSEGTVFGDGAAIGDTDDDGRTWYRESLTGTNRFVCEGPEFISIIDGESGAELARADYIDRATSESWGDSYWKRASSYRVAAAHVNGDTPSVIICRGIYGRSVLEAWNYTDRKLTRLWRFDTDNPGYGDWEAQGFHSLSVGDVDNDGYDEIVYGSMTVDHNGEGLYNSRLGHGDALHLGKFLPEADGLQIWSCLETGVTRAALRSAATGEIIWKNDADEENDTGRALVADIDPRFPGCEMWWASGNVFTSDGRDLGYQPPSCNMAIWFSGSLNRQLLDGTTIDEAIPGVSKGKNRVFTMYGTDELPRYDCTHINGTKKNPCWYGDLVGDWREEVILPTRDFSELRIFSTWFPTEYEFPWLMTDHVYRMSAINQNIGYNQPTQIGYYLGSDMDYDNSLSILSPQTSYEDCSDGKWYNLQGFEVDSPQTGLFIHNGKKILLK